MGCALHCEIEQFRNAKRKGPMVAVNLVHIEPSTVEKMSSAVTCQKREVIQERFGISVNTWVKIREGQAIRRSVALRLVERLKRDQLI